VIIPNKLSIGDKVGLVTPGGAMREGQLEIMTATLEKLGLEVFAHPSLFLENDYFAGAAQQRAEALNELFADDSIKAIFCIRGGFGCAEVANYLDYDVIRVNPKLFVGMSDITFLQNAIYKKTGNVSVAGPVVLHFMRDEKFALEDLNKKLFEAKYNFNLKNTKSVVCGEAEGVLLGGNMMTLTTMLGTQFLPEDKNIILFIEEVKAFRYALDRMLCHMKNAGLIDRVVGVIVGDNSYHDVDSYNISFEEFMLKTFEKPIPICSGAEFGHNDRHEIFFVGAKVKLKVSQQENIITYQEI
tara:strand:- start:1207 stop:2103 length:897 start_codon:yes stop_codon:yes gene_type:complete